MTKIEMKSITRVYKNNGQHAEQVFRFTVTGSICKADKTPAEISGDCGDIQVKSARATVCKGLDIDAYLAADAAKRYAYVTSDFTVAYLMNKVEWKAFILRFGAPCRESTANGGATKIRIGRETKEVREWLERA